MITSTVGARARSYPLKLSRYDQSQAIAKYQKLYREAFPHAGGAPFRKMEVASFGLSDSLSGFCKVGLGLWTTEMWSGGGVRGFTQKILMNLRGQLLPEHSHRTTIVAGREFINYLGNSGLVDIRENIGNSFEGIVRYNPDGSKMLNEDGTVAFKYKYGEHLILQPSGHRINISPEVLSSMTEEVIPGKVETFRPVFGNGILFCNRDEVVVLNTPRMKKDSWWKMPDDKFLKRAVDRAKDENPITANDTLFMTGGLVVRLLEDARHSFVAGGDGAVYEETSTISMDCADVFTDKRIVR